MKPSILLPFIIFIALLAIDWIFILSIQQKSPIITHWVIALPMLMTLFFALTLLALIGMYILNPWGFALAYFAMLFSIFFSSISFYSIPSTTVYEDLVFLGLLLLNVVVFVYMIYFNMRVFQKGPRVQE